MTSLLALLLSCASGLPSGQMQLLSETAVLQGGPQAAAKDTAPADPDPWLGKRVLIVRHGAEMRTPEKTVWRAYLGEVFTVTLTNGEWLWINEKGGWLWEKDAILYDTAVDELSKTLIAAPTAQNYHLRGVALLAHQQYDRAVADFTESLRREPRNAGALNNRGQAAYLKGDYPAALRDFSAAIALEPKNVLAINNRALVLISQEQLPEALADLQTALKQVPDYPEALNNRGVVHQKLGRLDDAVTDFSAALKIDPRYVDALGNRASAFRQKGQYQQAIVDLELARRISPSTFEATNDLAWLLATVPDDSIRNPSKSLELAKQAAELTQFKEWNVLDTYAVALALNDRMEEARTWLSTAITLAPEPERPRLQQHLELITAGQPVRE
jgi:tetratricopeptide (TPR) repeat protein